MANDPSFEWKNQVVVITGASAGIGAALAREVGRRGGSLVLAARRPAELESVAASTGAASAVVVTDVTRRADVQALAKAAIDRFGHVDVWVNNAGRGISRSFAELTDEDVDAMIRENVKSALYGMQAILPHFQERKRGHIVNVSSMLGRIPFAPIRSAYCAAKHALNSLGETLRMELAKPYPEVRVACVMPGVVATDFGLNAVGGGPDSRSLPGAQPVEEVAATIADAIAARRNGDVYMRPEAVQRVLDYYRGLAGA
ncbi:MAG TPA: SDR family NAD(P)-dependent oxidoreductase [Polyangiaceae bacterium]